MGFMITNERGDYNTVCVCVILLQTYFQKKINGVRNHCRMVVPADDVHHKQDNRYGHLRRRFRPWTRCCDRSTIRDNMGDVARRVFRYERDCCDMILALRYC